MALWFLRVVLRIFEIFGTRLIQEFMELSDLFLRDRAPAIGQPFVGPCRGRMLSFLGGSS